MCTSFLFHGGDVIAGFNFDTNVFRYRFIRGRSGSFYAALWYRGRWEPSFGVSAGGVFVNELMNAECEAGKYRRRADCYRLNRLVQEVLLGHLSFGEAEAIVREKQIVNAPGFSLHSHITSADGDVLVVEPGRGFEKKRPRYSVMTNFSLFDRENTCGLLGAGLDRYETAEAMLQSAPDSFGVSDAFEVLRSTVQRGEWPTVVSMVYSARENAVYYAEKQRFSDIAHHCL